jgi:hypothetical protein
MSPSAINKLSITIKMVVAGPNSNSAAKYTPPETVIDALPNGSRTTKYSAVTPATNRIPNKTN